MADDDRTIRDAADRTRINMQADYEVRYWTQKWSAGDPGSRRHGRRCCEETRQAGGERRLFCFAARLRFKFSNRRPCVDPAWRLRASNIARSRWAML